MVRDCGKLSVCLFRARLSRGEAQLVPSLGATSPNHQVQFSMSERVQLRTSVDTRQQSVPSTPRQPYGDAVGSQKRNRKPGQEQHAHIGSDPDLPVFKRSKNPTDCLLPNPAISSATDNP